MLNDKVWPAMSQAFEKAKGTLAERMMDALDAHKMQAEISGENNLPQC